MRRSRFLLAPFLVACLGGAVLWQATDGLRAVTTEGARRLTVVERPIEVPATRLTDMTGRTISLRDGRISVVEFIYTTCPTICRAAGDDFHRLRTRLREITTPDRVRLLSISFDPARDDRDQLLSYAETHGADGRMWTVARPTLEALPPLLETFGVTVIADGFGGFEHNIAAHVIDGTGRMVRILDPDDIEGMAASVEALLHER